jgi:hypothetical protein
MREIFRLTNNFVENTLSEEMSLFLLSIEDSDSRENISMKICSLKYLIHVCQIIMMKIIILKWRYHS